MRTITAKPYGSREKERESSILIDTLAKLMFVCGIKIKELCVVKYYA